MPLGRITKPAEGPDWGDYSGRVADLDGHFREIAHNSLVPLDHSGQMLLPPNLAVLVG